MAGIIMVAAIVAAFFGFVFLISKVMARTQTRRRADGGDGGFLGWGGDGGGGDAGCGGDGGGGCD